MMDILKIEIKDQVFASGVRSDCFQPSLAQLGDGQILTIQPLYGGDYYGEVSFSRRQRGCDIWSDPEIIPAFRRRSCNIADIEEAVVDVRSIALPDEKLVLAVGASSFYTPRECAFWDPAIDRRQLPKQRAVYSFFDAEKNCWSEPGFITSADCGENGDLRIACAQMAQMADGKLVLPVYFATAELVDYAGVKWPRQAVKTLIARVVGNQLKIEAWSNALTIGVERGFVEPSVKEFNGKWYMTIRAEDGKAYITTSTDALNWQKPQPWRWSDTLEDLATDSTQQHFLTLGGKLYLCFTRADESNAMVPRRRTPLFIAQVNTENLTLLRESEQIIFPLVIKDGISNMQGNFHCVELSPDLAAVVDGALYITPGNETKAAIYRSCLQISYIKSEEKNEV